MDDVYDGIASLVESEGNRFPHTSHEARRRQMSSHWKG